MLFLEVVANGIEEMKFKSRKQGFSGANPTPITM